MKTGIVFFVFFHIRRENYPCFKAVYNIHTRIRSHELYGSVPKLGSIFSMYPPPTPPPFAGHPRDADQWEGSLRLASQSAAGKSQKHRRSMESSSVVERRIKNRNETVRPDSSQTSLLPWFGRNYIPISWESRFAPAFQLDLAIPESLKGVKAAAL